MEKSWTGGVVSAHKPLGHDFLVSEIIRKKQEGMDYFMFLC